MDVVSERGPQFISKFWKEFCHLLGSSGYHPQSNGQTEKSNQDLECMFGVSEPFILKSATFMGRVHTQFFTTDVYEPVSI